MHPHEGIQKIEKAEQNYGFKVQTYQPHIYEITKDDIYFAINALKLGLDNTRELLANHEREFGRTTKKNQLWAEQLEDDIRKIESSIKALKENPKERLNLPPIAPAV